MDSLSCGWLFFTPAVTNCLRELGWGGHDIDRHEATYQGQRAQELRNRRLLIRLGVSGLLAKDDPGPSATKALTRAATLHRPWPSVGCLAVQRHRLRRDARQHAFDPAQEGSFEL